MTEERFKAIENVQSQHSTALIQHSTDINHILRGQERQDKKVDDLSQSLLVSMQNMFAESDRRNSERAASSDRQNNERIERIITSVSADHAKRESDWQKKGVLKGVIGSVGISGTIAIIYAVAQIYVTVNDDSLTKTQKIDNASKIVIEQLKKIEKLDGEIISKPQEKTE